MKKLNEVARMQQLAGLNEIKVNNPVDSKNILPKIYDIINNPFNNFELDDEISNELSEFEDELYDLLSSSGFDWDGEEGIEDFKTNPIFNQKLKELIKSFPSLSPKLNSVFNG